MKLIPAAISTKLGRQALTLSKNSPHILFGLGVVGIVGSTVLACRATLKLSTVLDEAEQEIEGVKTDLKGSDGYSKDIAYVYTKNTMEVVRLYAPAVILGTASIAMITGSHVQLTRRNSALTAAYAAVSTAYENYRDRVRNEYGEEKEKQLYHSVSMETIVVDGKNKKVLTVDPNTWSPYAKFFDEASIMWQKNAEANKMFVMCQQNMLNDLLQARGHVFLNEAYDALGLERTSEGQVVGWFLDNHGDNYIDFGLYEEASARFMHGGERSVILDFNVDGVVFDKLSKKNTITVEHQALTL